MYKINVLIFVGGLWLWIVDEVGECYLDVEVVY